MHNSQPQPQIKSMNVILVAVQGQLANDGTRLISSLLKREGHRVKTVFLARYAPILYQDQEIEELDDILRDGDLVLMSVYSCYVGRAIQITNYIHKEYPGMKVIWGGPHCIGAAELSLRYADGVCFAEAEDAIVELVNKLAAREDYQGIRNMAFKEKGSPIINSVRPAIMDLDRLPYFDYDRKDHFILDKELLPMTPELFVKNHCKYPFNRPMLHVLTTRGCPLKCTFCNNVRFTEMYGKNRLRFRSFENVIGEIEYIFNKIDCFDEVGFADDDFLARPAKELAEFAQQYKKRIGRPFALATSPTTYQKEKMEILLDAGLVFIQIGAQSGSERVLKEVYDRHIPIKKTLDVVRQVSSYQKSHGMQLVMDFIVDNPYETPEDIIQTYHHFVDILGYGVGINIFPLSFYPGTPLFKKALQDGLISPEGMELFRPGKDPDSRFQNNYPMVLLLLAYVLYQRNLFFRVPRRLLKFLGSPGVCKIASILPRSFYAFLLKVVNHFTIKFG